MFRRPSKLTVNAYDDASIELFRKAFHERLFFATADGRYWVVNEYRYGSEITGFEVSIMEVLPLNG